GGSRSIAGALPRIPAVPTGPSVHEVRSSIERRRPGLHQRPRMQRSQGHSRNDRRSVLPAFVAKDGQAGRMTEGGQPMKKAFDQNVSRAKPRLRLGAVGDNADSPIEAEGSSVVELEATQQAFEIELNGHSEAVAAADEASPLKPAASVEEPRRPEPANKASLDPKARRERLKARLKAARENPRPEPLPPTVAEAGVLAVERISTLQIELSKVKALNLSLTQDLEGARRQAEKATEEARLRMDEARRLASEMDARVSLLSDMEKELAALESERDEAPLPRQER